MFSRMLRYPNPATESQPLPKFNLSLYNGYFILIKTYAIRHLKSFSK